MSIKAAYDGSGNIVGFYNTAINTSIPTDSIVITPEQWQLALQNPGEYIISGGAFVSAGAPALLAIAKSAKKAELGGDYQTSVNADFVSDALGADNNYASDSDSITFLNCLISAGATANYPYENTDGDVFQASHTLSQLQGVLTDFIAFKEPLLNNLSAKLVDVEDATTVEDVEAITW